VNSYDLFLEFSNFEKPLSAAPGRVKRPLSAITTKPRNLGTFLAGINSSLPMADIIATSRVVEQKPAHLIIPPLKPGQKPPPPFPH
jgi:hypothetical protein